MIVIPLLQAYGLFPFPALFWQPLPSWQLSFFAPLQNDDIACSARTGTKSLTTVSNRKGDKDGPPFREDNHYVALCQKGDADAFRFLVEKYQKKMVNIAFRITGDYEEACETAQEAFLSAFRSIKKFRGDAAFSTWLTGITMNHARNRFKKLKSLSHHEGLSIDDPVESEAGQALRNHSSSESSAVEQLEKKDL